MCLEKIGEEKIAEENITVWKVCILNVGTGRIRSSYHNFFYEYEKEYSSLLLKGEGKEKEIETGIHSFLNKKDAKADARYWNGRKEFDTEKEIVVKCTIPKGSIYYEGEFNAMVAYFPSLASNKIILHNPNE